MRFIELRCIDINDDIYKAMINFEKVRSFRQEKKVTRITFDDCSHIYVKEKPDEINNLLSND